MSQCCSGSPKPINPLCAFLEARQHPSVTGTNAEVTLAKSGGNTGVLNYFPLLWNVCTHAHTSLSDAHHCISLHATLFPGICCYDNVSQQFFVCQVMGWLLVFLVQIWFIIDCKQTMQASNNPHPDVFPWDAFMLLMHHCYLLVHFSGCHILITAHCGGGVYRILGNLFKYVQ